jgi:hypothetical protein
MTDFPGSKKPESWADHLRQYSAGNVQLFDEAFLSSCETREWLPSCSDRHSAARLHVQLVSRIATQKLGYSDGTEAAALASVHALFDKSREISDARPLARHFVELTWYVLNSHVRPFTARWHRKSEAGMLRSLDATDDFRAALTELRTVLRVFDELLVDICDGRRAPSPGYAGPASPVEKEMKQPLPRGIDARREEPESEVDARNLRATEHIAKRRAHYSLPVEQGAFGLALSGGGIRSATFSLGVLAALARKGILPQVDYLSTVSGGGYLGAFLAAFLESGAAADPDPRVGLRAQDLPFRKEPRESAALGHIRQSGRYLAANSRWEQWRVAFAQFSGLLINLLVLAGLLALVAIAEHLLRNAVAFTFPPSSIAWAVSLLLIAMISTPFIALVSPRTHAADAVGAVLGLLLVLLAGWFALAGLHGLFLGWYERSPALLAWPLLVPALLLAAGVFGERLMPQYRWLPRLQSMAAMPLFLLALYLGSYLLFDILPEWRVTIVVAVAAVVAILLVTVNVNFTSLHRHYRRKLAGTFLIQHSENEREVVPRHDLKLSELGKTHAAPYPLINAAANFPTSVRPSMRGRLTDFFSFTPDYCGSPIVGYWPTEEWEKANFQLDLGTAMAISGAAASPQMGLGTPRPLSFWLALLNVRLNYWIRKPGKVWKKHPGVVCLLREMFSRGSEEQVFLNLSDGGHIENLGVYELLRRRCEFILAVDGEQDSTMTFHAITNLQRLAAIDLGVNIDIDLDDLRLKDDGFSASHFRFCRIYYPDEQIGYLLYVKLSLTGNEGEFIRRYKLDEPDFPHHSTANQFFTEAQFEAYRSLGEHIGEKLFLRAVMEDLADRKNLSIDEWFAAIGKSFLEPRAP